MHDVHQNQGDPAGSLWWNQNGIWQDGAVGVQREDATLFLWQVRFNSQATKPTMLAIPLSGRDGRRSGMALLVGFAQRVELRVADGTDHTRSDVRAKKFGLVRSLAENLPIGQLAQFLITSGPDLLAE